MPRKIFKTEKPVTLEGFQAVLKPSQYGYTMVAILDEAMIPGMEEDRQDHINWAQSKLKNPKRSTLKPEPWEEVSSGKYKVKFSWKEETKPPIVDTEGTQVTDEATPVYSGSRVKLAFYQKPYILKDGVTYGTSLKLMGVQLVSINNSAGVDSGDMSPEDVAELFGTTQGFKTSEPNITTTDSEDEVDF